MLNRLCFGCFPLSAMLSHLTLSCLSAMQPELNRCGSSEYTGRFENGGEERITQNLCITGLHLRWSPEYDDFLSR